MNPAHLDYDTLADLAEGMLDDDDAASASEHLERCAACRERSADLEDVTRILAEAPVPPIPTELATRIDAAISAEAMSSTAAVPSLERRRGRRRVRILSAAAATVIVLGGGLAVGNYMLSDSGSSLQSDSPQADSGKKPANDAQDGASGAGSGVPAPSLSSAPSGTAKGNNETSKAAEPYVRSGTDYRAATLDQQVKKLVGEVTGRTRQLAPKAENGTPPLAGCVAAVARGRTPSAVDSARYEGRKATLIAFPAGSGQWDIVIVGPGCSAQNPDLLKQARVPR